MIVDRDTTDRISDVGFTILAPIPSLLIRDDWWRYVPDCIDEDMYETITENIHENAL